MKSNFWFKVIIGLQIIFLVLLLIFTLKKNDYRIVTGERGEAGQAGQIGQPGYTPVKGLDYFDGVDGAKGDKGDPGEQGVPGLTGATGAQGIQGEQGEAGEAGQNGREIELRCRDFQSKDSQVQWRYVGDESWQLLYELKDKCRTD